MKGGGINALPRGEEPSLETLVFHSVCHASFLPRPARALRGHSLSFFSFCISSHNLCSFFSRHVSYGFVCVALVYVLSILAVSFVPVCLSICHLLTTVFESSAAIFLSLFFCAACQSLMAFVRGKCELFYRSSLRVGQAMKTTAGLKVL